MKIKRLGMLLLTLFSSVLLSSKAPVNTSAEEMFQLATKTAKGAQLVYNGEKASTDFAYLSVSKDSQSDSNFKATTYVVVAFDTIGIESITGIGFRIRYLKTNGWDNFLNFWQDHPTHGTLINDDVWVSSSRILNPGYYEGSNQKIDPAHDLPAIGKVSDLLQKEAAYWDSGIDRWHGEFGRFKWKPDGLGRFSNSTKNFKNREYYAVIPYKLTSEINPETIDYYNLEGEFISSGTDNGKPFKDTDSGFYYIDTVLTEDFGVAINGKNAILKKIEVSNFPSSSLLKVLVENASFDYERQMTTQPYNRSQFIGNTTLETDWLITNQNRYVFLKFAGEVEEAKQVKIRFYYTNDNEKASWIFRVKGQNGFLPPGWDTNPLIKPTIWEQIQKFVSIAFVVVIFYFVIKLLILLFNLIGSGRKAFGRRR
ncbi:MAG: hypothetical protein WC994_11300 [Brumimicrobium sp.]